jgi:glutamate-5-semialdehyde dehydrogenase
MNHSRSSVLEYLSALLDRERAWIIQSNREDLQSAGLSDPALTDRLKVDEGKIEEMRKALQKSALESDPDGKILYEYTNEEGLLFRNVTVPFGTILIIYESRPDVTIEAAALAFKSGNRILLKGGKEARNTNLCLVRLWKEALQQYSYDPDLITYLDFSREEIQQFISSAKEKIDLVIPRGGDALIRFVTAYALAPVIVSGRGNNFVYVHKEADPDVAIKVILNGKKRLSVCNATDKVLIDRAYPDVDNFIHKLVDNLKASGLSVYGNQSMKGFFELIQINSDENILYEEFLSEKIMLCKVSHIDEGISMINKYSGGHSASIISRNQSAAQKFLDEVDCAAVYHNASTRFTDGGQVGFGGEMAISTQKLHFRGPIGMAQLVTNKWMVYGQGHIRP